jgi:hypothetical protein
MIQGIAYTSQKRGRQSVHFAGINHSEGVNIDTSEEWESEERCLTKHVARLAEMANKWVITLRAFHGHDRVAFTPRQLALALQPFADHKEATFYIIVR